MITSQASRFETFFPGSSATSSGNNSHFNSHLHQNHVRSHSLDRTSAEAAKSSLDSSFDRKSSERSLSPGNMPPADGCSQTSKSHTSQGQPSPPSSSDTRGEVGGSSDNNSPPTSVIQVICQFPTSSPRKQYIFRRLNRSIWSAFTADFIATFCR